MEKKTAPRLDTSDVTADVKQLQKLRRELLEARAALLPLRLALEAVLELRVLGVDGPTLSEIVGRAHERGLVDAAMQQAELQRTAELLAAAMRSPHSKRRQ